MIPDNGKQLFSLLYRGRKIARRYLVTNGFDGALTMLGLMTGFYVSGTTELGVAINACLGAAIALFVSGFSSAYLSEAAECKKELQEMEQALLVDLKESHYGAASRYVPLFIASVNGFSPLLFSLLILTPLFLAYYGVAWPCSPFLLAIAVALFSIFLLGVYLGKISRSFWLWAGLRAVLIAAGMVAIILLFNIER
jgi:predicted membrane protein (TIGR00267 family)